MTTAETFEIVLGGSITLTAVALAGWIVRSLAVQVEDEEAVLVTRFGKLERTIKEPGWHWLPSAVLPWVAVKHVPLARDFREIDEIHVNDARGTSVIIDLWVELRIVDPAKAVFEVEDWDEALHNLVTHAAISILGNRDFQQILCDRDELGALLREDVQAETARWGIEVDQVFIRNVSLLPGVARQVLETIAARLERAKADIEEEGRQRVALLEAETSAKVAGRVAEAKGQYPLAVGRALSRLSKRPKVLDAYNKLYELSQLRPHRTVVFSGFDDGLRSIDAAMVAIPPAGNSDGEVRPNGVVPRAG